MNNMWSVSFVLQERYISLDSPFIYLKCICIEVTSLTVDQRFNSNIRIKKYKPIDFI